MKRFYFQCILLCISLPVFFLGVKQHGVLCVFKSYTGIPCAGCGITRSIWFLFQGDFIESLKINPIGLLLVFIILLVFSLILFDILFQRKIWYNFYHYLNIKLNKRWIILVIILLTFCNWYWNIKKGL